MKKNKLFTLLVLVSVSLAAFACSLFPGFNPAEATPTSDYIFTPSTISLKIEPAALPNAQTGVAYEVEILISEHVTPINSVFISDGALPAGLELVFVDGEDGAKLSGTPEMAGTFTFTVFVSCKGTMVSGQTAEKEYMLVVE